MLKIVDFDIKTFRSSSFLETYVLSDRPQNDQKNKQKMHPSMGGGEDTLQEEK